MGKGIGRIYQQTFVDTYSRVAMVKLYTDRTAITAADLLNDRVIPFFDEQKIPLLRILTDRGTEYCGKPENHAYQLYLGIENIDHSRTKANSPQTNGICERFHRTMQDECYNIIFRKKIYNSLEDLQIDVGCVLIMIQDLTLVSTAMEKHLCRLFLIANILLFRKILVALNKRLILVLTTSILLSVNSCLSD